MRARRITVPPAQWLRARRRILLVDCAFAAGLLTVEALTTGALVTAGSATEVLGGSVPGRAVAAVLSLAVPVLLRRAAPWTAVMVCVLAGVGAAAAGWMPVSHRIVLVIVAYTTASRFAGRPAAVAALVLWLPTVAGTVVAGDPLARLLGGLPGGPHGGPAPLLGYDVLVATAVFFAGRTRHGRLASARVLRERAAAAQANQRVLAAHAVTDERRRIARELHDVVAHHISVIGVLAAGARRVLRRDPAAADEALRTVADTSRTTLREMRRLLDVLRADSEPDAQLTPLPGLAGIDALVEQVREAGLPVRLEVQGTPAPMGAGVALSVYRIVQEALTNTLRHAGEATAVVRLRFDADGLTLHVSDTGHGQPAGAAGAAGVGHGLVGMRERVALYGGTLHTGGGPGGGFAVDATIPRDQLGGDV